jgi:hypothetical protein
MTNAREQLEARRAQVAINYKNNLLTARNAALDAIAESESAASVLRSMTASTLSAATAEDPEFRVVRRSGAGVIAIKATGTTLLAGGSCRGQERGRTDTASLGRDERQPLRSRDEPVASFFGFGGHHA